MIKNLTFSILSLLIINAALGQEKYLPGYVVDFKGDTLKGFVEFQLWDKSPAKISFKPGESDNKVEFTPHVVRGFGVNNQRFISAIIKTEISPSLLKRLEENPKLKLRTDTAFMQMLIGGPKPLFHYKNTEGNDNFYIQQEDRYELLLYKRYLITLYVESNKNGIKESKTFMKEDKQYVKQLAAHFSDCSGLLNRVQRSAYTRKSLEQLFSAYYDCSPHDVEFSTQRAKARSHFGIIVGGTRTTGVIRSESLSYLLNTDFGRSSNFAGGFLLDYTLPFGKQQWSFYNDLLYTTYNLRGDHYNFQAENKYVNTFMELEYSYLKLNTMLRYRYEISGISFFGNAGLTNGYAVREKNYRRTESKLQNSEWVNEEHVIRHTRKYEQGYVLGLGTQYKRLSVEGRYEKSNGMSNAAGIGSTINRYYFLAAYRL